MRAGRALATALILLVSACAGIPTSGKVNRVTADDGFGQSTVRYSPAGPAPGATPQEIVRGFLDAMLAYPVTSGTAEKFLTPTAEKGWDAFDGVRVYGSPRVAASSPSSERGDAGSDRTAKRVKVRLDVDGFAVLDRQGHYTAPQGDTGRTFRLEQVDGEWRIVNPQVGMLVTEKFFDDYFRPFNIYLFDRPGKRLVPVPIYVAVGDQLATTLVTSLTRGPRKEADENLRTYVPSLSTLRPSVPLTEDGVADVEFDADFTGMSESIQDRFAAQVVWTLRQVPGVTAARMAGAGTVLSPDGLTIQPIGSWGAYGPSIARGQAFALHDNQVVEIDEARVAPIPGVWGKDARGAVAVAVAGDRVAGVLAGRTQVRISDRDGSSSVNVGGSGFIEPRWDDDDRLWLLDRAASRTRVRVVEGTDLRTVKTGGLAALDVTTFSISPNGARYVATVDRGRRAKVYVGAVRRGAKDEIVGLGEPARLSIPPTAPGAAVWSSGTTVSYLADSESGRQIYTTLIDGSVTTGGAGGGGALLPDVGADTVVLGTGPSPPSYATDARDRVWYLPPGGSWQLLDTKGVTGLTFGR